MEHDVALSAAMKLRDHTSAGKVEIALSYGEDKRGGPLKQISKLVDSVRKNENVSALKVSVKKDLDAATEVLDLVEHREIVVVRDDGLKLTVGRRLEYHSRINAIRTEFQKWLQQRT